MGVPNILNSVLTALDVSTIIVSFRIASSSYTIVLASEVNSLVSRPRLSSVGFPNTFSAPSCATADARSMNALSIAIIVPPPPRAFASPPQTPPA